MKAVGLLPVQNRFKLLDQHILPGLDVLARRCQITELGSVIPIHTQHYMMLQRNLRYTAVTRGKKLAVLVGTKKALGMPPRASSLGKTAPSRR